MTESEISCDQIREQPRIPRPPNAFMLFGKGRRKALAEEHNQLSNKEISKILGNEWQKLDKLSKEYFQSLADEAQRQHKLKYPGYYYSPLEARQRKALRKRRTKMSIPSHQTESISSDSKPLPKIFCSARTPISPFMHRIPFNPMVRPVFPPYLHPRFGSVYRIPYNNQFVSFRYQNCGFAPYQSTSLPIHPQNADFQPTDGCSQLKTTFANLESHENESKMADIGLLTNYLPPMHNPSVEAMPVVSNEELANTQNSTTVSDVTRMANAEVVQEFILPNEDSNDGYKTPDEEIRVKSETSDQ